VVRVHTAVPAEITQEIASHESLFVALILLRVGIGSALVAKIRLASGNGALHVERQFCPRVSLIRR
jgi:hypothetical protein